MAQFTISTFSGLRQVTICLMRLKSYHRVLVQQAKRMALPLWTRMADYYEDADYDVNEVSVLADETACLQNACRDAGLLAKLKEIEEMLRAATDGHNRVSVIAD